MKVAVGQTLLNNFLWKWES